MVRAPHPDPGMRITNQALASRNLRALSDNLRLLADAQDRVATGKRFQRASEDPSAASEVMRTDSSMRAMEQYRRNLDAARGRVNAEEAVLDQLNSILIRAQELAVSQASDTASAATREAAKEEVDNLLQFALTLGNTRFGDEFLFGGHYTDSAPFDADADLSAPPARDLYLAADPNDPGSKREPTGHMRIAISPGFNLPVAHNGSELLLDSGVLESLHELSHALGANDQDVIRDTIGSLQGAFDRVQVAFGTVGARTNQIEITESGIASLYANLQGYRSGLADAEFERSATELAARQSAYQAALLATSRVLNLSITDYLR